MHLAIDAASDGREQSQQTTDYIDIYSIKQMWLIRGGGGTQEQEQNNHCGGGHVVVFNVWLGDMLLFLLSGFCVLLRVFQVF